MACSQCVSSAVAGGTTDALTIPLLPCAFTTTLLVLKLTATNLTTAPTLQMTGLAALPILKSTGLAPSIGQLTSGTTVLLTCTGASWLILGGV